MVLVLSRKTELGLGRVGCCLCSISCMLAVVGGRSCTKHHRADAVLADIAMTLP